MTTAMEGQGVRNNDYCSEFDETSDNHLTSDYDDLENAEDLGPDDDSIYSMSVDDIIQSKLSKNIRDLRSFFSSTNFITEKGDQKTNIIDVSARKTYFVPNSHMEEFFESMEQCRKEGRMLHYSERQETSEQQKSGIMIDFDRYQRAKESQFNERHFDGLARWICKLFREFLDLSEFDETFVFRIFYIRKPEVVLVESKLPNDIPKYKDGFHMLIPEVQVSKGFKKHLMQELISRGAIKSIFKDIDHIEPAENMLDKMSASVPVHFIGNSKPGRPAYPLSLVHEIKLFIDDEGFEKNVLDQKMLSEGFLQLTTSGEKIPINLSYELSLTYYSPTINKKPTWLKKRNLNYKTTLETKIQLLVEKTSKNIISEDDLLDSENSVDILTINDARAKHLKKLLSVLDISYATNYEKWFKVVCAIAHTSLNYKPLAIWFSHRRPESWSSAEIDRVWAEATNGRFSGRKPVTLRSIIHWAKESSPQAFREIEKENYYEILARYAYANEGRVEHHAAADVTHSMIGDKFTSDVAVNDRGTEQRFWFEFVFPDQKHKKGEVYKWRREVVPDNIHLYVARHLPKVYDQLADNIKQRKDGAANEGEMKYWANVERNFRLFKSKLGNDSFQNGVVRQADKLFRQRGFIDELDSYEDIIGVGNGILRIGLNPQLIRGFHEFKISKYTETDYKPFNPDDPYIQTLLKGFHDIFPEDDVFEFMMYHASTGLDAREAANILLMLIGGGQNGKSFFAKMIHNTLGNMYCASGKPALLTSPAEKGNEANSAQMQMSGKRAFYFDEFGKCERLNDARLKGIVNPGWQSGRDVYGSQRNFRNTCNPMCLSNFDFLIDTTDHGTWRRIYYYKNKMKFCRNPNPENPFEKPVDSRFMDEYTNDPLYRQAMLSIMVHYYEKLCKLYKGDLKNVPVPTIERETEIYRNSQDALNKFITQMIVKSPTADIIGLPSLAGKYIEWYNKNIKPTTQTIIEVQSQLENSRIGQYLERRNNLNVLFLIGFRLKAYPEEPIQEDEEELTVQSSNIIPLRRETNGINDLNDHYLNREREDASSEFFRDLTINAPTHIQRRDDNVVSAVDVDSLLASINDMTLEGEFLDDI